MSCRTGKTAYTSPQSAHKAQRCMQRRPSRNKSRHACTWAPATLKPYRCQWCGGFHLGHEVRK